MTPFRIDHIVILVHDLAAATADYAALGFTVVAGGEHATGLSRNALIALADGSYIELIAFRNLAEARASPRLSPIDRRFLRRGEGGEGLVDWALLPANIEADIEAARGRGLTLDGPIPGGRTRPDGQQVRWMLGVTRTLDLPFLCADVTPRVLRVPAGPSRRHANGVTGVARLTVVVSDPDASAARHRALLGVEPKTGAQGVDFVLGAATLTLVGPGDANLRDCLATRGDGLYALTLRTIDPARAGPLDLAHAHGARVALSVEANLC